MLLVTSVWPSVQKPCIQVNAVSVYPEFSTVLMVHIFWFGVAPIPPAGRLILMCVIYDTGISAETVEINLTN